MGKHTFDVWPVLENAGNVCRQKLRVEPGTLEPIDPFSCIDGTQVVDIDQGGACLSVRNASQPSKAIQCTYDRVFNPDSTQEDVFKGLVPALDTVLEGYNACVLAYGQTGSGKTHTLIGPGGGTRLPDHPADWGVIPRSVQFLFDRLAAISEEDQTFAYSVTCSFLQIYNEEIVDLLQDGSNHTSKGLSLQIREESSAGNCSSKGFGSNGGRRRRRSGRQSDSYRAGGSPDYSARSEGRRPGALNENRRVFVNGLSSFRVAGAQDVLHYINVGATNRRVRATQHNEASSRSHAVMQLMVEAESSGGGGGGGACGSGGLSASAGSGEHVTYRQAKLSLVDLAGSEKMDSTINITRTHFKELRNINKSLSALGNVVSALSEKHRTHVPYRDSKLTRLLQDSLGGNTRTTIIACVSPLAEQTNDTVSTLQFADRAKKVMVRLRPNEVVDDRVLLARAQAEIVRLKQLLRQALDNTLRADAGPKESVEAAEKISLGVGSDLHAAVKTITSTRAPQNIDDSLETAPEKTAGPGDSPDAVGSGNAAALTAASQRRQVARLIADSEHLREENERLKTEVQRLVDCEHQRQKQKKRHYRRGRSSSFGSRSLAAGRLSFSPSPVDWGVRYADAAEAARRRRRPGSSSRSSILGANSRGAPSRARSASPSVTATRASIPRFRRHAFQEEEGEVTLPERAMDLSTEKLREILGEEGDGEGSEMSGVIQRKEDPNEVKAVRELERFRSELDRLASADRSEQRRTGEAMASARHVNEKDIVVQEAEESQRLEDVMFEAQGRERQRVREERARLSAARAERLALEAQLASLNAVTHGDSADLSVNPETAEPPTTTPQATIRKYAGEGHTVDEPLFSRRVPTNGRRAPLADVEVSPTFGDKIDDRVEGRTDAGEHTEPCRRDTTLNAAATAVTTAERDENTQEENVTNKVNISLSEQCRTAIASASQLPMARQTGWTTPPPRPQRSPSRRRPVTSAGNALARTRSWRSWKKDRGGSQSPTRVSDSMHTLGTSSKARKSRAKWKRQQHQKGSPAVPFEHKQVDAPESAASLPRNREAKLTALYTAYPLSHVSSPGGSGLATRKPGGSQVATAGDKNGGSAVPSNKFQERDRPCTSDPDVDVDDAKIRVKSASKGRARLAYSVADRGLRLTVYSFRYDHYYECQIIGYDARRKMHRCAYDATGEKQWHDLRTKRFEVVGQNGVVLRSTESAP